MNAVEARNLEKALEHYRHGYLDDAASIIKSLIEEATISAEFNPQLQQALALVYTAQGKYREAEALFEQIFSILGAAGKAYPLELILHLLNSQGQLYHEWGYSEKAAELYQKVLATACSADVDSAEASESLQRLVAHTKCNMGDVLRNLGRYGEAEALLLEAEAFCRATDSKWELETVNHNLALLYLAQERAAQAEEILTTLLETADPSRRDLSLILGSLAGANIRQGKYVAAEAILMRVLAISENLMGKAHPNAGAACSMLAEVYLLQQRYEEAEVMCRKALSVLEHTHGLEHEMVADVLLNLACARHGLGQLDGVEALERWAISNVEKLLGKSHPKLCRFTHQIALNYHNEAKYAECESYYRTAIDLYGEVNGAAHPSRLAVMAHLALAYSQSGKAEKAKALAREVVELIQQVEDAGLMTTGSVETLEILADLSYRYRDYSISQQLYNRADALLTGRSELQQATGTPCRQVLNMSPATSEKPVESPSEFCAASTAAGKVAA
jgi:tetratricopeptide (TPR) repeat protein